MARPEIEVTHTRKFLPVDIVQENPRTLWVRLPDGNVIKRKKSRDVRKRR